MQDPNILLAILGKMAQKPEVRFDKLYQKLYNTELWLMAYEQIAPNQGNMTPGTQGNTIDGMEMTLIENMIADLKASTIQATSRPTSISGKGKRSSTPNWNTRLPRQAATDSSKANPGSHL